MIHDIFKSACVTKRNSHLTKAIRMTLRSLRMPCENSLVCHWRAEDYVTLISSKLRKIYYVVNS